jgi:hypothetical protein
MAIITNNRSAKMYIHLFLKLRFSLVLTENTAYCIATRVVVGLDKILVFEKGMYVELSFIGVNP